MEFQTSEEGIKLGFSEVGNALIAVPLDDKLELVGQKWLVSVNLDGLGLFRGEEGLEATLDFRLTRKVPGMTTQRFDRLCT